MSAKSLRFEFDAMLAGPQGVIVCRGARRFRVVGLDQAAAGLVAELRERAPTCATDALAPSLVAQLTRLGLVCAHAAGETGDRRVSITPRLSARQVGRLVRPVALLGSPSALALIAAAALAMLLTGGATTFIGPRHLTGWLVTASLAELCTAVAVFFACVCLHELGHAAACLRHTGVVGGIRFTSYRGAPALAIDVSSIVLTDRRGKVAIALAGLLWQLLASALVLAVGSDPGVEWGARMSIWAALFTLLPLPNSDGYWCLSDWSGRTFSPRLLPRPPSVVDGLYALALLVIAALIVSTVGAEAATLLSYAAAVHTEAPLRAALFSAVGLYAMVLLALFVRTTVRQARRGLETTQ